MMRMASSRKGITPYRVRKRLLLAYSRYFLPHFLILLAICPRSLSHFQSSLRDLGVQPVILEYMSLRPLINCRLDYYYFFTSRLISRQLFSFYSCRCLSLFGSPSCTSLRRSSSSSASLFLSSMVSISCLRSITACWYSQFSILVICSSCELQQYSQYFSLSICCFLSPNSSLSAAFSALSSLTLQLSSPSTTPVLFLGWQSKVKLSLASEVYFSQSLAYLL